MDVTRISTAATSGALPEVLVLLVHHQHNRMINITLVSVLPLNLLTMVCRIHGQTISSLHPTTGIK